MYKINFNHLYYFSTIAKEGSIVKASKVLNMTQPALSHQLRLLEEDLGVKLFDRVGRKLVLNENGERAREYAVKIFRNSEEMVTFFKSDIESTKTIIKIGAAPWVSKDQIYSFLRQTLFNQFCQIKVFQNDVEGLLEDVENEQIDIALCDAPYSDRLKALQGHYINHDPIVCVASEKKGFKGRFPKCLNEKKMINYSEACFMGDNIDQFLKINKLEVQTVGEFSDIGLIRVAVRNGGVAAFLPRSVVKQDLESKKLVSLGVLKEYSFSLWAITRKDINRKGAAYSLLKGTGL
ncbi:MAG: LysR family transcriptional regulator [Bacteriovoracaceae bacterium]